MSKWDLGNPEYNQIDAGELEQFKRNMEEDEKTTSENIEEYDVGDAMLAPAQGRVPGAEFREADPYPERRPSELSRRSSNRQVRAGVRIDGTMLTLLREIVYEGVFRPFTKREWLCQCDCGNQCVETYNTIYAGSAYSCGCTKRARRHRYKLQGKQYGRLIVGEWTTGKGWECVCEKCGDLEFVRTTAQLEAAGESGCPKDESLYEYEITVVYLSQFKRIRAKSLDEAKEYARRQIDIQAKFINPNKSRH